MDRSVASADVFAKASGMLASSFAGPRLNKLFEARSLHELWKLVFKSDIPAIPEMMLAKRIEKESEKRFVADYIKLLGAYSKPDEILVEILRFYDYDNLKEIGARLCFNLSGEPDLINIGQYSMLHWKDGVSIDKLVANTPVSWFKIPDTHNMAEIDFKLDRQYMTQLWLSINKLPRGERKIVHQIVQEEIVLSNILWALRLKVYFSMHAAEIIPRLIFASEEQSKDDVLAGEAMHILDYPVDSYNEWKKWKHKDLLNPHQEGVYWEVDPCWVQQTIKHKLYHTSFSQFHRNPFTAAVLLTWFKIKQFEAECIRTAAEALRLNVEKSVGLAFAGVTKPA
jgi:vacuolar-type H+-ATPase subunit C/Vma6